MNEPETTGNAAGPSAGLVPAPAYRRCTALTKAGKQCINGGVGGSDRCVTHTKDVGVQALVADARRRAGSAPRIKLGMDVEGLDVRTAEGVQALMAATIAATATGRISAGQASAITAAARVALQAAEAISQAQIDALAAQLDAALETRRR